MANTDKMITETVLKDVTEKILQTIADKIYDLVPYDSTEISEILEISDEEAMELTKIISDNIISTNKIWSSNKTNTEIQNAIIEANKYADELIGQISSISLEYVTALPTSDIKSNVIYILQGTPNTLNVYNTSTSAFVTVGDLDLDLSQYYTKSDVDTLLADKADDNTVVHQEDIVSNLTITSGTTTLSTAGLQTELDKKANDNEVLKKTDISTSIDSASTDDEIPTSKAVETRILKRETIKNVDLNTFVDEGKYYIDSGCTNSPVDGGYLNIMRCNDDYVCQICARYNIAASNNTYIRTRVDGKWGTWKKVCTTSVVDVPLTSLAWADTSSFENAFTRCNYQVKNGICFVNIDMICNSPMTGGYKLPITLPAPNTDYVHFSVSSLPNGVHETSSITIVVAGSGTQVRAYGGVATHRYLGMLSYPVAES